MRRFIVIILVLISFVACNDDKNGNEQLLTQRIQYEVAIKSPDLTFDWWVQNIEGANRENFVKGLINSAFNGSLKIYDDFGNILTKQQIEQIETSVDTTYFTSPNPPYDDTMVVATNKLEIQSITKMSFLEEWKYNNSNYAIEKRILGYAPLIEKYDLEGNLRGYKPLFWVYYDEKYPQELKTTLSN